MIKPRLASILLFVTALLAAGCIPQRHDESAVTFESDLFKVVGHGVPRNVIEDVANELALNGPEICRVLDQTCTNRALVEIFPTQASLDRQGMNPEMQGYYAYSGNGIIQMVSPIQSIPGIELEYTDRLAIVLHEYAHLVNDEVNPAMPLWMDEGVAVFVTPHRLYETVTQHRFPFDQVPHLEQLEQSYKTVPAADLFAFSFIEFIATEFGQKKLNQLVRSPESMEQILSLSHHDLEERWLIFMQKTYVNEP